MQIKTVLEEHFRLEYNLPELSLIEGFHYQLRNFINNKGCYQGEYALLKLGYTNIRKKIGAHVQNLSLTVSEQLTHIEGQLKLISLGQIYRRFLGNTK